MPKYLIATLLSLFAFSCLANTKLTSISKEPKPPIVMYVDPEKIEFILTPNQPSVIRILCTDLKGKGEVALTLEGITLVFPIDCPEKSKQFSE